MELEANKRFIKALTRSQILLLGFLQTGQIFLKKPPRAQFARAARQLVDWGWKVDWRRLEEAYFQTRVSMPKQYESVVRLRRWKCARTERGAGR